MRIDSKNIYNAHQTSFTNLKIRSNYLTINSSINRIKNQDLFAQMLDKAGESIANCSRTHVILEDDFKPVISARNLKSTFVLNNSYEPPFKPKIINEKQIMLPMGNDNYVFDYPNEESMKNSFNIMSKANVDVKNIKNFVLPEDLLTACCEIAKQIEKVVNLHFKNRALKALETPEIVYHVKNLRETEFLNDSEKQELLDMFMKGYCESSRYI